MPARFEQLVAVFIWLILIIEGRVEDRLHLVFLVELYVLFDWDFSCLNFIFGCYIQNCVDSILIKLPYIRFLFWVRTKPNVCIADLWKLELPLEVSITFVNNTIDKEDTVCIELFTRSLSSKLTCIMIRVVHLERSLRISFNDVLTVSFLLVIILQLELFANKSTSGISVFIRHSNLTLPWNNILSVFVLQVTNFSMDTFHF